MQRGFNGDNVVTDFGQPVETTNKSLTLESLTDYVDSNNDLREEYRNGGR